MMTQEARTVCVLRRMRRKSLGLLSFNSFNPKWARPEELRFDILDERDRVTGSIVFTKLGSGLIKVEDTTLTTPWGPGRISFSKEGPKLFLNERELVTIGGSLLKKGLDLIFSSGAVMSFMPVKGKRNDIEFSDGTSSVSATEERGRLTGAEIGRPLQLTKEEIKALPKDQRPTSVETLDYIQIRIRIAGKVPIPESDLVAALAMLASYGQLAQEMLTSST